MFEAGRAFRAPRASNVRQWRKVELLLRNGVTFHHYGWGDRSDASRPATLREVMPYLAQVRASRETEGERLLRQTRARRHGGKPRRD
jgi:hypothetical protein